jgi:hypothetical protein
MRLPRAMSFVVISLSRARATKEVALAEDSGRPKPALRPNASDGKQRRLSPRAEGRARRRPPPLPDAHPNPPTSFSPLSLSPKMLSRSVFSSVARASRSVRASARPRLGNQPTPGMRRTGLTFPCCLSPCSSPPGQPTNALLCTLAAFDDCVPHCLMFSRGRTPRPTRRPRSRVPRPRSTLRRRTRRCARSLAVDEATNGEGRRERMLAASPQSPGMDLMGEGRQERGSWALCWRRAGGLSAPTGARDGRPC